MKIKLFYNGPNKLTDVRETHNILHIINEFEKCTNKTKINHLSDLFDKNRPKGEFFIETNILHENLINKNELSSINWSYKILNNIINDIKSNLESSLNISLTEDFDSISTNSPNKQEGHYKKFSIKSSLPNFPKMLYDIHLIIYESKTFQFQYKKDFIPTQLHNEILTESMESKNIQYPLDIINLNTITLNFILNYIKTNYTK